MGTPHEDSNLLPEALKAIAGPVASTALGIGTAALGRSWSNQDWKNQTAALNRQAIDNARNSPLYLVDGLRRAGLNPALAAQGQYNPASVSSAPMQQHNMPVTPFDLSQLELTKANANLADSQANLNNVEAQDKQIEVNRKKYEDATHDENLTNFFSEKMKEREAYIRKLHPNLSEKEFSMRMAEDPTYYYFTKMRNRPANSGTAKAYREFSQILSEDREAAARIAEAALREAVAKGQLDTKVLDTIIHAPNNDREEQLHRIALMLAQAHNANASADKTYHTDLAAMIKNGDKLGAFLYGGEKAMDILADWSPFMWLKALRGAQGKRVAPTTQKAFDELRGLKTPKGLTGNHDF